VQPHALINLLQDGLWFDKLQAEAANVRGAVEEAKKTSRWQD
jgi:hypothetical protein